MYMIYLFFLQSDKCRERQQQQRGHLTAAVTNYTPSHCEVRHNYQYQHHWKGSLRTRDAAIWATSLGRTLPAESGGWAGAPKATQVL